MGATHLKDNSLGSRLRSVPPAQIGLAVVEATIAYEWLLSGLDKCLSSQYLAGLSGSLSDMAKGNPNTWYAWFLQHVAIAHSTFFGCLVAGGEILTGLALLAGAALWLVGPERLGGRWGQLLQRGVLAGLAGAMLMTANYYLMAGKTLPWLNPSHPYDEGLSLDGLLTLMAAGLLAVHLVALRCASKATYRERLPSPVAGAHRLAS
jgi:thiosulfate dehydrogenase [quinone] large subunit